MSQQGRIIPDDGESAATCWRIETKRSGWAGALKRLPEREMQVISLYYYEGLTLKEIGKVLGVTESRVPRFTARPSRPLGEFSQRKGKESITGNIPELWGVQGKGTDEAGRRGSTAVRGNVPAPGRVRDGRRQVSS